MSIFKHQSGYYYIDIGIEGSPRIRRSARTKNKVEAQQFHDQVRAELWRQRNLGHAPKYSFDEAALEFLKSHSGDKDYETKKRHVSYWVSKFSGRTICSLTTDEIDSALPSKKQSRYGGSKPVSGPTKNRYLATINKILSDALKRGWIDKKPYVRKYKESKLRESFLTHDQANRFLDALGVGWMRDVCEFALATGMRASEILTLEWAQVDADRGLASVLASKAKSGSSRPVPLNDMALSVIERRKTLHDRYVFARKKTRSLDIDRRMFNLAAKKSELPSGFRFHDLRHTWASWHAQAGTPMLTLQRLGGWKTLSMLNRYAHLSVDDLARFSSNGQITAYKESRVLDKPALRVVNG